eukprot:Lithocolla_globosa_v1_NODE_2790_length_1867_cov_8.598234.p1 type:complete len:148 gc:universal NODE_2790_length_1867_cov_8.598234:1560-1117(-)
MTAIEVNSRLAFAQPLKNKKGQSILEAFEMIKKDASKTNFPITKIGMDRGSEFQKDDDIEFYTVDPIIGKNSMAKVERFNRTLRGRIEKYLTAYNTNKWVEALQPIVKNYNNTIHSTIKFKPSEVGDKEMKKIREYQTQRQIKAYTT